MVLRSFAFELVCLFECQRQRKGNLEFLENWELDVNFSLKSEQLVCVFLTKQKIWEHSSCLLGWKHIVNLTTTFILQYFSVFSVILYFYEMDTVPRVNVGDWWGGGRDDKTVTSAARQKVKQPPFLLTIFTHKLYVAAWLRTLCCIVKEAHRALLPSEGKVWDSSVMLPFIWSATLRCPEINTC